MLETQCVDAPFESCHQNLMFVINILLYHDVFHGANITFNVLVIFVENRLRNSIYDSSNIRFDKVS